MGTLDKVHALLSQYKVRVDIIPHETPKNEAQYRTTKIDQWKSQVQPKMDQRCYDVIEKAITAIESGAWHGNSLSINSPLVPAWSDLEQNCRVGDGRSEMPTTFCFEDLGLDKFSSDKGWAITLTGNLTATYKYKTNSGFGPRFKLAQVKYSASSLRVQPALHKARGVTSDSSLGTASHHSATTATRGSYGHQEGSSVARPCTTLTNATYSGSTASPGTSSNGDLAHASLYALKQWYAEN